MKTVPILGFVLLALFGLIGCKGQEVPMKPPLPTPSPTPAEKPIALTELTGEFEGTIKGVVKLKGKAPEMKENPALAKHSDKKHCLSGPLSVKVDQEWLVGKDNELANVVVILAPPGGKKFKIDDDLKTRSKDTKIIDQPYCNYEPHVVVVWPEVQGVVFQNSAPVLHNVKITSPKHPLDETLKPKSADGKIAKSDEIFYTRVGTEEVITASCSMHSWMAARIAVFNHPYIAVTKDDGTFEIPNVPIGEMLTVYLWHESAGNAIKTDKKSVHTFTPTKGDNPIGVLEYVK